MTLEDFGAGFERAVVEGVRELAKAAAHAGNEAAFAQLATDHEAAQSPGRTDLSPETEGRARGKHDAVEVAHGTAEILDLAELPQAFVGRFTVGGIQRRRRARDFGPVRVSPRNEPAKGSGCIVHSACEAENPCPRGKGNHAGGRVLAFSVSLRMAHSRDLNAGDWSRASIGRGPLANRSVY